MPRFSLRQVFVAVVALAMGFAIYRLPQGSWIDVPLSALGFYFVLSLARHAAATRRLLIETPTLPREQRWGGRIFIGVLVTTVVALVVAWIFDLLASAELTLTVPNVNNTLDFLYIDPPALPRNLIVLAMLAAVGVGSRPWSVSSRTPLRQKLYQAIAVAGLLIVLVAYWADRLMIWFLVYIAINGVEAALPQGSWTPEIYVSTALRAERFMQGTAVGLPLVVANLVLTAALVRWWSRPRVRLVLVSALAIGLAGESTIAVWLGGRGLRQLSPPYYESIPFHGAALAVAAAMILVTVIAFAWRTLARSSATGPVSGGRRFFHQTWLAGLALGLVALASVVNTVVDYAVRISAPANPFSTLNPYSITLINWSGLIYVFTENPAQFIGWAAMFGGFGLAWTRWRRRGEPMEAALPSVDPGLFVVTVVSLVWMLLAGAVIIAAAGFSYWLLRAWLDI